VIDFKKIEGKWIALDDKDRFMSIGKELDDVVEDC